jgi:hypothetical protein
MIWPVVGLSLLLLGLVSGVMVFVFHAQDRDSATALVQTVTAVMAPAASAVVWLLARGTRTQVTSRSLDQAADDLAEQLRMQWSNAARERHLSYPAPIPVRWRWSQLPVTGPATEAIGESADPPRFRPLPGIRRVTAAQLQGGGITDLLGIYGGLDSGRLILLGSGGAGKSAAAIRLLLDALTHRQALQDAERSRVPVPVLFTVHGWDPTSRGLLDWLAARLANDHTFLKSQDYGPDAAAQLVNGGHAAIILDGLDEMPESLRSAALRAMDDQAMFRLILLTRSGEILTAASGGHLTGAAALELLPVGAEEAASYLSRCQVHPLPQHWQHLVDHLRAHPGGPVAQALDNPLMLTLLRDIYRLDGQADEIVDPKRFASREAVEDHLLDRVLPSAYAPRPGQAQPRYPLEKAERWLASIADRMNHEASRDLVWWRVLRWKPVWPRVVVSSAIFALLVGLLTGFLIGSFGGLIAGLLTALLVGISMRFAHVADSPQLLGRLQWRESVVHENLRFGVMGGVLVGLAVSLGLFLTSGNGFWLIAGSVVGAVSGIVGGLVTGATTNRNADARTPIGPVDCWRQDRQHTLVAALSGGIIGGLAGGSTLGLLARTADERVLGAVDGIWSGTVFGLILGLILGLTLGIVGSVTWRTVLVCGQLRLANECPIRLVRFLEDARQREVLRTVGPVYQFRHARLQDRLSASARHRRGPPAQRTFR